MNLVVDIGNTSIKLASVDFNHQVVDMLRVDSWSDAAVLPFLSKNGLFANGIVSTVRNEPMELDLTQYVKGSLLFFDSSFKIPIANGYDTPATLGLDRLAAAVGANNIFPNSNVLVVDCGTAITIDLISSAACFEGGNISLGLHTRFKALASFTSKLPLVDVDGPFPLVGKNTTDAIRAGVINSVLFELDAYIDRFTSLHPDLKVLFTGGDAFFFDGKLKNTIFVVPNLVVQGLNRILEYNV